MQTPVEIDFQGMAVSPSIREKVERHVDLLETRFGRITSGRVVIKGPGPRHLTGGLYDINIRLAIPNAKEVDVGHTKQNDERFADIDFALNDAFKRARRQLQDRVRRLQGKIKHHEPAPIGSVARLDHSGEFGFIATSDGREVYFHKNSVLDNAFHRLRLGDRVTFAEETGEQGLQASTVRILGKHGLRQG